MKRTVEFSPAWSKRDPDPKKDYGIGGVSIRFILKGKKGATQFLLWTKWYLPEVQEELLKKQDTLDYYSLKAMVVPLPADVGYHSYKPIYEGHEPITESCKWLEGKPCYCNGSSLRADDVYKILLREGSEGVWRELEKVYKETFGGEK